MQEMQVQSPEGGHGKPFQYTCLDNPMDRGALMGYSLEGHKESDMTEAIEHVHTYIAYWDGNYNNKYISA